jgi:hypothetical protein
VFKDDPELFQMYDELREQSGGEDRGLDLEMLMFKLEKLGQTLVQRHN